MTVYSFFQPECWRVDDWSVVSTFKNNFHEVPGDDGSGIDLYRLMDGQLAGGTKEYFTVLLQGRCFLQRNEATPAHVRESAVVLVLIHARNTVFVHEIISSAIPAPCGPIIYPTILHLLPSVYFHRTQND